MNLSRDRPTASNQVPEWLARAGGWAWRLVAIGAALAGIWLVLVRLRVIIVPMVVAVLVAALLDPLVRWLQRRGLPRLAATWLVFLAVVGLLTALVLLLLPGVESEAGPLGNDIRLAVRRATHWLEHGPLHLSKSEVNHYVTQFDNLFSGHSGAIVSGVAHGVATAVSVVGTVVFAIVLSFLFVSGGERISRALLGLVDRDERRARRWRRIGATCWRTLSGYVIGTTLNGVVNALLMSIGLIVLRVPLVMPIAVLTFLGAYLPLVGAFVAGGIAALVALAARGVVVAALVVAVLLAVHAAEGYLVGPVVLGRSVHLTPLGVVLALAVGDTLLGIEGAFLAVPVTAVISALIRAYRAADIVTDTLETPNAVNYRP